MPRTRSQREALADSPLKSLSDTKKPRATRKKKQPAPPQEPSPPASADEQEQEGSHSKSLSPTITLPPSPRTSFNWPTSTQVACGNTQINRVDVSTQTDPEDVVNSDARISLENSLNQPTDNEPEEFRKLTRSQLIDLIIKLRASSASSASSAAPEASSSNSKKRKSADDTEDTGHRTIRRRRESDSPQPAANTKSTLQALRSESKTSSKRMASIRRQQRPLPINRTPTMQRPPRRPQSESTRRFLLTAANVRMTEDLDSDDDGIPIDEPPRPPPSSHLFPDADSLKYISGNAERFRKPELKDQEITSPEHVSQDHVSPKDTSPQNASPQYKSPEHTSVVKQQATVESSTPQVPETPRNRGWGFGALVNSVPRAISKFIPGLQQPAETAAAANVNQSTETHPAAPNPAADRASPADIRDPSTPAVQFTSGTQAPRTAPSKHSSTEKPSAPATVGPTREYQPPRRKAHEREQLLKKRQAADQARNARHEEVRNAREGRKHERSLQTPGSKRKRSPDVIPNPIGCSYGLDPAFFGDDSTDEEYDKEMTDKSPANKGNEGDAVAQDERHSKRARVSDGPDDGVDKQAKFHPTPLSQTPRQRLVSTSTYTPYTPPTQVLGDPHRARPYTGTMFADPKDRRPYYGGNVFSEAQQYQAAASQASSARKPYDHKPESTNNRRHSFAVPDDSDDGKDHHVVKPDIIDQLFGPQSGKPAIIKEWPSKAAGSTSDESGPKTPNIFSQAFEKRKERPNKGFSRSEKPSDNGQPLMSPTPLAPTSNNITQGSPVKVDPKVPTQTSSKPQQSPPVQPSPATPKPVNQAEKPAVTSTPPVAPSTTGSTTPATNSTSSIGQPSTSSTATSTTSTSTEPSKPVAKAPVTWTQPPPARPTPAHALLPIANPSGPSSDEALARVRSQAEKYKPKQPSGLRASSRLSNSTVGSDVNDINDSNNEDDIDNEDEMTEAQHQEVLDAVNAIPVNELLRYNFPVPQPYPVEKEVEDAVTAARAAMTPEQRVAETQSFKDDFASWKVQHGYVS